MVQSSDSPFSPSLSLAGIGSFLWAITAGSIWWWRRKGLLPPASFLADLRLLLARWTECIWLGAIRSTNPFAVNTHDYLRGEGTPKQRGGVAGLEPALGLIPVAKQAWLVGSNSLRLNQSSALTIFGHPFTLYEAGRHLSRIEGLVLRHPPYPSKIRTLQSP